MILSVLNFTVFASGRHSPIVTMSPILTSCHSLKKTFLWKVNIALPKSIILKIYDGLCITMKCTRVCINRFIVLFINQFNDAIKERKEKGYISETTFIGINSAEIKEHNQNKNMLEVSVEFVSEIISCIKDKDNKVVSGDAQKVKKVLDTWKFTKDSTSKNPNWLIVDTQA